MSDSHAYFRLQSLLLSSDVYDTLGRESEQVFTILPELRPMVGFRQANPYHSRDLWDHTIFSVAQVPADFVLRLTMLLHDLGKLTTRTTGADGVDHFYGHQQAGVEQSGALLERIGVSEAECIHILRLIALHDIDLPDSPADLRAMADQFGVSLMTKLITVKQADALAQSPDKLGSRLQELEAVRRQILSF